MKVKIVAKDVSKWGFPDDSMVKNPARARDMCSISGSGKSLRRREWQPSLIFWPGKHYGQRNLIGYRPGSHKSEI